jgi:hypothetical protein
MTDATIGLPNTAGGQKVDVEGYTNASSTLTDREVVAIASAAPSLGQTTRANVAFTGSGKTQIIAGVSGKTIRIMRMLLVVAAATNIEFLDASSVIFGAFALPNNGSIVLDHTGEPWMTCATGDAFQVNSSVAVTGICTVWYTQS